MVAIFWIVRQAELPAQARFEPIADDMRDWRLLRASNPLQQCPIPSNRSALFSLSMSGLGHVWTAPWQELSDLIQHGRVRSRVRPVDAARMAAGPNAVRG